MQEKFSVLMSLYYKEKPDYFNEALKSIWDDQTLKPTEIILILDGKLTSELYKIVDKWKVKLGKSLMIVSLEVNIGFAKALNIGLEKCSYELVARMDTDDISFPQRFKEQITFMQKNGDIAVCGSFIEEFDANYKKTIVFPTKIEQMKNFIKLRNPMAHPSVVFRKSVINEVGGYPENLRLGQDYGLWSILIARGYKITNIPKVLLRLRTNRDFYKRRGLDSLKYEVKTMNIQYKEQLINSFEYIKIFVLRSALRLSPIFIKKIAYTLLRK